MKKIITILSIVSVSLLCFVGCNQSDNNYMFEDEVIKEKLTQVVNLKQGEKFVDFKFSGRSGNEFVVTRERHENEQPEIFTIKNINTGRTIVIIEN